MNNNNNNSDIYMKKISQSIVIHKNHDNNYDDDDDDDDGNIDANSSLLVGGIENIHSDHNSINNDDNDNNNDNAPTKFLYLLIGCLAIGGFLFGYDTGVIAGALLPIKEEFGLSSQEQEFVVGGTTLGAILGGLLAGALSDLIGRKPVTLLSSVIFIVGAALMTFAHDYWLLLLGRLVVGVGVGLAALVVPLYIGELAPSAYRGRLVTMNVLMITGGQLIAYLVSSALTDKTNGWRWMMAISGFPALLQLVTLPFLPESPRYLVKKGNIAGAKAVLRRCMGLNDTNHDDNGKITAAAAAAATMVTPTPTAIAETTETTAAKTSNRNNIEDFITKEVDAIRESLEQSHKTRYRDLLRKDLRRPLIIACFMQLWQQLSGFNTAMYYSATILKMAGFPNAKSATLFSLLIAGTNMIMTIVAIKIIDRVGRRKILLVTIIGMIAGLIVLGVAFIKIVGFTVRQDQCVQYGDNCAACLTDDRCYFQDSSNTCQDMGWDGHGKRPIYTGVCPNRSGGIKAGSWVALASLVFYVASYGLGLGNAPWLIQSELFPLDIRGKATGMATACNFAGNLVISLTFLTLTQRITATGTFWLYAGILVIAWLFVYFLVPETAGLNLEAIQELFRKEEAISAEVGGPTLVLYPHQPHHQRIVDGQMDESSFEEEGRRRRRGHG
ncbi:major facilitator superfamily domain-containing protein [Lobosporangium transversale]|uniref:Major facilitator superfamily domain-containing protein n=1 Tax=Lobosporangium transversale TaxID=64571 RepID=A0A1Y2GS81_9FUNG|nr:major facilitator superfamily domain-containing protein [Lobosporangium transversale]ORZ21007.1 major facilitator superfamily domain-containing protein [Lobosporangium transversale]|eukprot:XP_021882916.1 major facilitator superfamily domain-containing protein [Lobosporangium transversale]